MINLDKTHQPRLMTVKQFCEKHPAFTQGGLRYLIFNAKLNGFDLCLKRVGRRVLIDEEIFLELINKNLIVSPKIDNK